MKLEISAKERSSDLFQKGVAFAEGVSSIVEPIPDQRFWKGMFSVALDDPHHNLWGKLAWLNRKGKLDKDLVAFIEPLWHELHEGRLFQEVTDPPNITLDTDQIESEFRVVPAGQVFRPRRARAMKLNFAIS